MDIFFTVLVDPLLPQAPAGVLLDLDAGPDAAGAAAFPAMNPLGEALAMPNLFPHPPGQQRRYAQEKVIIRRLVKN